MKLYGSFTSPFVRHCRIALLDTGLECEFIETDAAGSSRLSPTKKVPFLQDDKIQLTDSSSILKYLREKAGQEFLSDIEDFDLFCMVNTVLDASVNVFFCERLDGLTANDSKYLKRHNDRIKTALKELNGRQLPTQLPLTDGQLRLACYLDWALFRQRVTLDGLDNLTHFLTLARSSDSFLKTTPPEGA